MSVVYWPYYNKRSNRDEVYNQYIIETQSNKLPLDLNTVKQHLSIDLCDASQDTELLLMIKTVALFVQKFTNRVLLNTTFLTFRDYFPGCISLRKSPFQSLVSFEYVSNTNLVTVDPSTYQITQSNDYVTLVPLPGYCWPSDFDYIQQTVRIRFIAGYGNKQNDIPAELRSGMLNHIGALYADRGDCACENSDLSVPKSSLELYNFYKIKNVIGIEVC